MSKTKGTKKSGKGSASKSPACSVGDEGRAQGRAFESLMVKQKLNELAGPALAAMASTNRFAGLHSASRDVGAGAGVRLAAMAAPALTDRFLSATQPAGSAQVLGSVSALSAMASSERLAGTGALGSVSSLFNVRAGVASLPGAATGAGLGVRLAAMAAPALTDRFLSATQPAGSAQVLGSVSTIAAMAGPALPDRSAWTGALGSVSSLLNVKAGVASLPGAAGSAGVMLAAMARPALTDRKSSAWAMPPEKVSPGWAGAVSAVAGLMDGNLGSVSALAAMASTNRFAGLHSASRDVGAGVRLAAMAAPASTDRFLYATRPTGLAQMPGSVSSLFDVRSGVASLPGAATGWAGVMVAAVSGSSLTDLSGARDSVSTLFDIKAGIGSAGFEVVEAIASALAAQPDSDRRVVPEQLNSSGAAVMSRGDALRESHEIIRLGVPVGLRKAAPSLLLLILLQLGTVMQIGAPQWLDSLGKIFGFAVDGLELYLVLRVVWQLNRRD